MTEADKKSDGKGSQGLHMELAVFEQHVLRAVSQPRTAPSRVGDQRSSPEHVDNEVVSDPKRRSSQSGESRLQLRDDMNLRMSNFDKRG
jgi:hypothetical protein